MSKKNQQLLVTLNNAGNLTIIANKLKTKHAMRSKPIVKVYASYTQCLGDLIYASNGNVDNEHPPNFGYDSYYNFVIRLRLFASHINTKELEVLKMEDVALTIELIEEYVQFVERTQPCSLDPRAEDSLITSFKLMREEKFEEAFDEAKTGWNSKCSIPDLKMLQFT